MNDLEIAQLKRDRWQFHVVGDHGYLYDFTRPEGWRIVAVVKEHGYESVRELCVLASLPEQPK